MMADPDVVIKYCSLCGFKQHADPIAESIEKELGLSAELREGSWGAFQIVHGQDEVFNRWKTRGLLGRLGFGKTPTPEEIVERLRTRLAESQA